MKKESDNIAEKKGIKGKNIKVNAENITDKRHSEYGTKIITDPFGSWTGVVEDDFFDKPIQDVDDL